MNENLHKLHLLASDLAFKKACEANKCKAPQQHSIFNFYIEIFADLLIRECARISDKEDCTMTGQGTASVEKFMKHFGIKHEG